MTTGLLKGNCLEQLLLIPDASVDSVVTDPPYELGFMGKGWDASGIAYNVEVWKQCFRVLKPGGHLLAFGGTRTYHRIAVAIEDAGFEIRDSIHWTYGSGFPKSLNISKAIDKAAGAEREIVGYSKGVVVEDNQGYGGIARGGVGVEQKSADIPVTAPSTPDAQKWNGWGTALKPSHEPVIVARKPVIGTVANNVLTYGTGALNIDGTRVGTNRPPTSEQPFTALRAMEGRTDLQKPTPDERTDVGRWPANTILTHSPDCRRVGVQNEQVPINRTEDWTGFGQVERPDYKQSISDVSTPVWNCVEGCPAKELDGQSGVSKSPKPYNPDPNTAKNGMFGGLGGVNHGTEFGDSGGASRFFTQTAYDEIDFTWQCVEGCPVMELDEQSGVRKGGTYPAVRGKSDIGAFGGGGTHKDKPNQARQMGDIGGASRYFTNTEYDEIDFPPFVYQAKANSRERSEGLGDLETKQTVGGGGMTNVGDKYGSIKAPAKNFHPTVKPVSLMRHLVRLVTPKGGLVLDPFLGSGTTAVAALLENCQWVGCELTEDYWPIIEGRTTWAQEQVKKPATIIESLF